MNRLEGKVCLVTGAAGGIGTAISEAFAREGGAVAAADVDRSGRLAATAQQASAEGRRIEPFWVDVADEASVELLVSSVRERFGRIDVLVNCAGVTHRSRFVELSTADWDRVLSINLRGTFLVSRHVVPVMLEANSGRIINVASQLGQIGGALLAHYSASKAGVIGFTKALARELSPAICVNAIAPGPILTDMIRNRDSAWFEDMRSQLPLGRIGTPEEVAPTAVFLASADAALYTGQTLGPNSGHVML
ncbi:MAG: 3-oxoacyl-ACP reductase FabG [Actinomycetota bacterium]|nr:3-oxoacyl-ACP reductase FabG [Actinomycetota bacterium]